MKKLLLIILLPFITFAQEDMIGELRIQLTNHSYPWDFTFSLIAVGARWDDDYDLTEDYGSVSVNLDNYDYQADYDHILHPSQYNPEFAVGLYKIIVTPGIEDGHDAYIYMDWRTSDWSSSLDVSFLYDVGNERFRNWADTETLDYTYQTLWDLTANIHETSELEDFWSYALVMIDLNNENPNLVWGPHPSFTTTHFYIYRAVEELPLDPKEPITYSLCAIRSASTFQFTDSEFDLGGSETHQAFYYVKAYNSSSQTFSSASNGVNTSGEYAPNKIGGDIQNETQPLEFDLNQNYPNPFNPSTTISWQSPVDNFVTLKVFDVLGREVALLVNEYKEAGTHSIEFNASELSSGIYMYSIQIGSYIETRKLILQK